MPHSNRPWHDDEEDWSETGDEDDDLDAATFPCPECGTALYDDTDHCLHCGHWLTDADFRAAGHTTHLSRRVRLVAAVMIVVFLVSLLLAGSMF